MRKHQRLAPPPSHSDGRARASTLLLLLLAAAVLLGISALPWLLSPQYHFACRRDGPDAAPAAARISCVVERRLWWLITWEGQRLDGVSAAGLHTARQPREGGAIEQHWLALSSAPQQRLLLLIDENDRRLADELQGFIDSGRSTLDTGTRLGLAVTIATAVSGGLGLVCLLRLLVRGRGGANTRARSAQA